MKCGVCDVGIRKTSSVLRLYAGFAVQAGFAGTWGPGYNRVGSLHVKDCAEALVILFKAALEGKADEGRDGLCTCSGSTLC